MKSERVFRIVNSAENTPVLLFQILVLRVILHLGFAVEFTIIRFKIVILILILILKKQYQFQRKLISIIF